MKKLLMTLIAAVLFAGAATAQTENAQGAKFIEATFADVQKAAEKAGKPIFVDIYTTWCGPCKYLSSHIFPAQAVGDYMNATFVNTKFDAEKGEGIELAKKYAVKSYPTMLILNSKGEELGRLVGSNREPEDFVQRLKETMAGIEKK